ncbi:MAG: hypothetical protein J0L84_06390, partial [Verrucomicrobia bacterium]|nr:hypothetical protein [Verrucomicrobiota bacterium]
MSCSAAPILGLLLGAMPPACAELVPITVRLPGTPQARGAAGDSRSPVWAASHRFVFFVSAAPDLVPDDWNGTRPDLFRRDRVTGSTLLVSAARASGEGANAPVVEFSVSADGRHVAFVSEASNLVPGDDNGAADVFVRDLELGTTRLVSWNLERSGPGVGAAFSPVISADGRRVLYGTAAANVDPDAPPFATPRLCLRDLESLDVTLVGNEPWLFVASADLDVVIHASEATPELRDLAPGSTPTMLRVWRAATGTAKWIQIPTWNYPEGRAVSFSHMALTPSGRHLALYIPGEAGRDSLPVRGLWRLDLETGTGVRVWAPQQVLTPPQADWLSMTGDGRQIAFTVPPLFDTVFGEVRVWTEGQEPKALEELTQSPPGQTASLRRVQSVRLSPQADRLVYHTFERVPEAGVTADGPDRAYLRTLATGATRILATGEVDIEATFDPSGEHLAFSTSDPLGGSSGGKEGSYIITVDRTDAPPALVSVAMPSPEPLTSGASVARVAGLSDDGQRILYCSIARDLVTNATSGNLDAYLHDTVTG